MCFPAVAAPLSSCQYTMVPLQGMALVGHCPLDSHLTPGHTAYTPKGEYTANGKHHTHCLPGLHQVSSKIMSVVKQIGTLDGFVCENNHHWNGMTLNSFILNDLIQSYTNLLDFYLLYK